MFRIIFFDCVEYSHGNLSPGGLVRGEADEHPQREHKLDAFSGCSISKATKPSPAQLACVVKPFFPEVRCEGESSLW